MSESQTPLLFDPGAGSRRAPRTSVSTCFCRAIIFISLSLVALFFGMLAYGLWGIFSKEAWPHTADYHDPKSLTDQPVVPLWRTDERFDVGVSVWVRPTEEALREWRARRKEAKATETEALEVVTSESATTETPLKFNLNSIIDRWDEEDQEEDVPLFSDVVFRGVRLRDKNVLAAIHFELPTARFCAINLTTSDLRASFFLIPTSPSLFDYVTKWSYWIPQSVVRKRVRTWPFPLGSPHEREKTMQDRIIEAGSINVPLLQLRGPTDGSPHMGAVTKTVTVTGVKNPKVTASTRKIATEKETSEAESDYDEDDAKEDEGLDSIDGTKKEAETKADDAIKIDETQRHPYVVTRTQLRVINDQNSYSLKAFNNRHNALKASSDLERIPVNRSKFTAAASAWNATTSLDRSQCMGESFGSSSFVNFSNSRLSTEEPSMNVTWHISYSGRTPAKSWFADRALQFSHRGEVTFNSTAREKLLQKESLELAHAVGGHRYHPNAHRRRKFFFDSIASLASIPIFFLDLAYWWNLPTTVGISVMVTLLQAAGTIVMSTIAVLIMTAKNKAGGAGGEKIANLVSAVLILGGFWLPPIATLRGAGRISVTWSGWIPTFHRALATHRERASERMDRKTSNSLLGIIFGVVFILNFVSRVYDVKIIPALLPPAPPEEDDFDTLYHLLDSIHNGAIAIMYYSQIKLNQRQSAFAGRFRVAAWLDFLKKLMVPSVMLPVIGGRWDQRPGWILPDAVELLAVGIFAYQAWSLPRVQQESNAEDE
ncbi:hypothetical protein P7C70_g1903, partial [Phenoliferia sp. Uapishka_3]